MQYKIERTKAALTIRNDNTIFLRMEIFRKQDADCPAYYIITMTEFGKYERKIATFYSSAMAEIFLDCYQELYDKMKPLPGIEGMQMK